MIRRTYGDLFHLDQRFLGVIGRNSPLRSKLGKAITGCIRYDVEEDVVLLAKYFQGKDASLLLEAARAKALIEHNGPSLLLSHCTLPLPNMCPEVQENFGACMVRRRRMLHLQYRGRAE